MVCSIETLYIESCTLLIVVKKCPAVTITLMGTPIVGRTSIINRVLFLLFYYCISNI